MRCNKHELAALASQTSQNFDREGVMILKEKQDGFFRRSEGSSERWFRLRGNLLFYLKGPEPWQEPVGVIVLGHHQIKLQEQDDNGYWPFHIVWENGACYRLATFNEAERTQWLIAIQKAPYDVISSKLVALTEKLNKIRTVIDITTYRLQKGIVLDLNEIPLCELALSCDNLLCDAYGRPPSPLIVIYIDFPKGLCIKYGNTEIVETCSNPAFSKTVLFRSSDGITRETMIKIMVYDVKERVSQTAVPMGFTSLKLSTIQEAQRLRVALLTNDNKNIGFVTINGWSLEPSYIATSPSHKSERYCFDIPHKYICHRRSHSLPPRLGLKLKFPIYGNLLRQNFVNIHQVTYKFHSGLGGDITVHEVMSEPKLCYQLPMQLLDIYIQREKELIDELLSVVGISGQWQSRQLELAGTHMSLLKYYSHSKRCLHQAENAYFKSSSKKDDSSLAFAPINMHLQRMWACNDTLNKIGFHNIITVGAFSSHAPKSEATGGLIRLVQQIKDISSAKAALNYAAANKIQSEYDNVMTLIRLRNEIVTSMERIVVLLQANQRTETINETDVIKGKEKSMLALFEPSLVEESLAVIGWPKRNSDEDSENQAMSTLLRLTEQLSMFDSSDCDTVEASTSTASSKETSPSVDSACASSSSSQSKDMKNELQFYNDYFNSEERSRLNSSFRSVRSPTKPKLGDSQSLSFDSKRHGSFRHDFKSTASLEQVSYRSLMESLSGIDKKKNLEIKSESPLPSIGHVDSDTREDNLALLKTIGSDVHTTMGLAIETVVKLAEPNQEITDEDLESLKKITEEFKLKTECLVRWIRLSHVALRLRYESPSWAKEHAALQTRRDICFSQALTALTAGLFCWFWSVPGDVVYKLLIYDMGPLCEFEGLLTLYALEKAIWGDMVVAVEDLQTVVFTLVKTGSNNVASPYISGTRGALTVYIPVSDNLYNRFTNKEDLSFTITAVFFNIGVNNKATLAEALGETTPQYHSNNDNFDRLYKYYHKYNKLFPTDPHEFHRVSLRAKPLEEVVESLRIAVHKRIPKNIEVLQLAALATRLMNGVRFTSCKSAKDRTGMSVTLEQCSVLAAEYQLAEHEVKRALNIMRSEGCRRENTVKNIGVRKYAFTQQQVMGLPLEFRPPPGTYGAIQT